MKIMNFLTIQNLKLNKKRTIVTILGITLSVALVCAITTFVNSFQSAMLNRVKMTEGNYHIRISNIEQSQLKYIENHIGIKHISYSQPVGYAVLEGSKNENKPYVYISQLDEFTMENNGIKLSSGRMPENDMEIVISEHISYNAGVELKIGDTVTWNVGNRMIGDEILTQHNPYVTEKEIQETGLGELERFEPEQKKTYTIVGIIKRTSLEDYSAPGYMVISKLQNIDRNRNCDISLLLKNVKDAYKVSIELTKGIGDSHEIETNDELLRFSGIAKSDTSMEIITIVMVIVIAIIMFTSVFVIRNSFMISITERTKQLGMLASIGATSKQLKKTILLESFLVGVIAIPLGVILGIFAIWIVLLIVNGLLLSINYINDFDLTLNVSLVSIIITIIVSMITICISSITPARRAGKISPIDAIKETKDIKITSKKLKTSWIVKKILGIEGTIASKNLKRSKKKYRTTIFSIFLSVVLFITMSSVIEYGFKVSSLEYKEMEYNIHVSGYSGSVNDRTIQENLEYFKKIVGLNHIKDYVIVKSVITDIDRDQYYSENGKKYEYVEQGETNKRQLNICAVNEEFYMKYVKSLGLSYESVKEKGILYDTNINYESNGDGNMSRTEYNILKVEKGDSIEYTVYDTNTKQDGFYEIAIAMRTDKTPMSLFQERSIPVLIVSEQTMETLPYYLGGMYIQSDDSKTLKKDIEQLDTTREENVTDYEETAKESNTIVLIISIFLYGFIAVISVIGITNIFNTITTNMALRSKEFAILKSIGMTNKEFKRMIRYESILYGTKALLYGIPVGLLLSYAIYQAMGNLYHMIYVFPWKPVLISILFVFAIVFITMHYSVKKTKKQNIIEVIRNENI